MTVANSSYLQASQSHTEKKTIWLDQSTSVKNCKKCFKNKGELLKHQT